MAQQSSAPRQTDLHHHSVSYEGLVPGKEYSLDAQLISKADGKTVLGETKGHTFKPEAADGTEAVTITVNDEVTEDAE